MFLVIASRFKNLRGQRGTRWGWACLALFPLAFLLGFLHPILWAIATLCLEVYIISTAVKEWKIRSKAIAGSRAEAAALRARAEQEVML